MLCVRIVCVHVCAREGKVESLLSTEETIPNKQDPNLGNPSHVSIWPLTTSCSTSWNEASGMIGIYLMKDRAHYALVYYAYLASLSVSHCVGGRSG